jgi:hypothetical protein
VTHDESRQSVDVCESVTAGTVRGLSSPHSSSSHVPAPAVRVHLVASLASCASACLAALQCGQRAGGAAFKQIQCRCLHVVDMASFARSRSGGSASGPSRHNSAGDSTPVSQLDDEDRGSLEPYLPAVVQVFCSSAANDWCMPWSRALPVKSTGSGWIYDVQKRIIVTNAHVVEFASTLQVPAFLSSHSSSIFCNICSGTRSPPLRMLPSIALATFLRHWHLGSQRGRR